MFDVDRADLLRKVKARQLAAESSHTAGGPVGAGKMMGGNLGRGRPFAPPVRKPSRHQTFDPDVQAAIPAQIDARCNFCSAPLGLGATKRQHGERSAFQNETCVVVLSQLSKTIAALFNLHASPWNAESIHRVGQGKITTCTILNWTTITG